MTTSKRTSRAELPPDPTTVTVTVKPPFAVYFDGDQRTGTITHVPPELAEHWASKGWTTDPDA